MPTTINEVKLYSVTEIAILLNVSPQTVLNYTKQRKLIPVKIGRATYVKESDLLGYLNRKN